MWDWRRGQTLLGGIVGLRLGPEQMKWEVSCRKTSNSAQAAKVKAANPAIPLPSCVSLIIAPPSISSILCSACSTGFWGLAAANGFRAFSKFKSSPFTISPSLTGHLQIKTFRPMFPASPAPAQQANTQEWLTQFHHFHLWKADTQIKVQPPSH